MNKYLNSLNSTLTKINTEGLNDTNSDELWLALNDYICNYVLRSKTNTRNIDILCLNGFERCDIELDILVHCVCKIELILKQDIEVQGNYIYKICNNFIYEELRKNSKTNSLSLDDCSDETISLYDVLADKNCDTEARYILHEQISEGKNLMLHEISKLSKHPAEALIYLSNKAGLKPRELSSTLKTEGVDKTISYLVDTVTSEFNLPLMNHGLNLNADKISSSLKLDSSDLKMINAEISRKSYNLNKRLS